MSGDKRVVRRDRTERRFNARYAVLDECPQKINAPMAAAMN
jgi:hypothetical protein